MTPREAREKMGWSRAKVSGLTGRAVNTIIAWEAGEGRPGNCTPPTHAELCMTYRRYFGWVPPDGAKFSDAEIDEVDE